MICLKRLVPVAVTLSMVLAGCGGSEELTSDGTRFTPSNAPDAVRLTTTSPLIPLQVTIPPWTGGDPSDPTQPGMAVTTTGSGSAALTELGTGWHNTQYKLTSAPALNTPYTFSARVQAGSRTSIYLQLQSDGVRWAQVTFDLQAATVSASMYGATGRIQPVSGQPGKYDVAVTGTFASAPAYYAEIGTTKGTAAPGVAVYVESTQLVQGSTPAPVTSTTTTTTTTSTSTTVISVAVSPATTSVVEGHTAQFSATVTGTTNTAVNWTVQEGAAGGAMSATGLYTAPSAPGTYHVVAASQADPSKTAVAAVSVSAPLSTPSGAVLAFPGCQGSGCAAKGGRGGTVYKVTNLNDSGAGSLRACVQATGPRTCVFTLGGHIALRTTLAITNPFITIAGQSAPGGGIELSGQNTNGTGTGLTGDLVQIQTHDVVIRYVKMRLGNIANPSYANSLVVQSGQQYNVVVDHCTLMWGLWDNLSIYATGTGYNRNQTYSWNIISEPLLQPGATGSVNQNLSGANSGIADASTNVDFHHNFYGSGDHRSPIVRTASGRLVNNVIYNYNYYAMKAKGNWDIIGNYFRPGPMSSGSPHEILSWTSADGNNTSLVPSLYLSGNAGKHNSYAPGSGANSTADWSLTGFSSSGDGGDSGALSTSYQRSTALPTAVAGAAIVSDVSTSLVSSSSPFMASVGASQGLGCSGNWISNRDSVDARIINEFLAGTGTSNKALSTISGYPTLAQGTPCVDTDGDGIPDAYETAHGLNARDATDGNALQADGYTNLEHYLSGQ